jgi:IS30 family transposase
LRLEQDKWSPEMIAGRIKMEQKLPSISHESIYQYIYIYRSKKLNLYRHLMYARPKRQLKFSRKKQHIYDIYKIRSRHDIFNKRQEFGHFEGDLTFFKGSKIAI